MGFSHCTDTATFSFNPYLPLVGRLFEVLRAAGPVGTVIATCNRTLAERADCSAGAIPAALRTLEADGHIERVTTPRGSLIVVTERSAMPDQLPSAPASDQDMADRPPPAQATNPNETPDRSAARSDQRSDMPDPPRPPTWNQHDQNQQQQRERAALFGELLAAGAARSVAVQILERNPELTSAEFVAMREAAKRRGSHQSPDAIGLVFWCLLHQEPLHSPKEPNDEQAKRPTPCAGRPDAPYRSQRSGGAAQRRDQPALTREYLQSRPRRSERV